MIQNLDEYRVLESDTEIQFLNEQALANLEKADANPFVRFNVPDKSVPFIVLSDGTVVVDITASNPLMILRSIPRHMPAANPGAGFIDIYHGNKTLNFRHIKSAAFGKKWHIDEVATALQAELHLYYPGYKIRSR